MWGFFLNSSRLLKEFRKIKGAMPCNASYSRLFLWKDFYIHDKLICILYALLCRRNVILAKSGCYKTYPLKGISPSRFRKCSGITRGDLL
jgi:hypothetical protein